MTHVPGPRRLARVTTLLTLAWLTAIAAVLAPVGPANASECDGVWVVVDPGDLGGEISVRCAPGDPANGIAALEAARHAVGFVPNQPGFICTIDRKPDPCNGAPANAYWSYWHAPVGGSWTYSSSGAGFRDPAPGTVEGWRFGSGQAPPAPPPGPAAPPRRGAPAGPRGGPGGGRRGLRLGRIVLFGLVGHR
ncbi:MAG: hypothetical protein JJT89_18025, partial [Nitriliruptoraceae bacterium]|nr:hypothetical protein [Nitriliruptoraceae bacterium]